MHKFKSILPILLSTIWISFSEFLRNQVFFSSYWTNHYKSMGLTFPSEMINGAVWGIWSLVFAITIYILLKKFNLKETVLLAWVIGFVLMWLVIGNLGVLPFSILPFAIPWSFVEVSVAAWMISKLKQR